MIGREKMKKLYAMMIVAVAALSCSTLVMAQAWPQRTVKVAVPFAAGGNTDSQARIISERLTAALGQPFVVENRAGAGGAIAADYVAKAAADGYTLFFAASPLFTLPLIQKVNFDPYKDFVPISMVGTNPFVLGVYPGFPAKNLKEFIAYVKSKPGQITYATGGNGSISHLAMAAFINRAGLDMIPVHYKGGGQVVADLFSGRVPMFFGSASEMIHHAEGGKVRLLAVSGAKRAPQLPNVPAIAEFYPGFDMETWNGFLAPTGTPKAIVDRLAIELARIVRDPVVIERFKAMGVDPLGNTPAEFAKHLRDDAPVMRAAVHAAGL
jgi:tripartite-type tricarboxylate transporter receptor subunit TctC